MSRLTIHPTYRYPNGLLERPPSERNFGSGAARWLGRGLLLVLGLLALVFAAWVALNWRDVEARPRPAELALPVAQMPAQRNVYFTLMGLQAAPERDANKVGQARWQEQDKLAQALLAAADSTAREAALKAAADADKLSLGSPLALPPTSEPWACDELTNDCVALGLAKPDALAQQRQSVQAQGTRCDATVEALQPGQNGAFEEVLPAQSHAAAVPMAHLSAALACARWQHSAAVLAFRQGRKEEAWRTLARSNQWHRALLAGSHTLVTQMMVHSLMRRHLAVVTGLAVQDPAWVAQALPLLAPFGAPEAPVRRWMVAEAAMNQSMLRTLVQAGGVTEPLTQGGDDTHNTLARLLNAPIDWLYRHHIGWHPERTAQLQDAQWVQRIQQLDAGLPAAVAAARAGDSSAADSWLKRWWVNPAGRLIVDVAGPAYAGYLHRPLDLELHREAALLGLNALRLSIAPAARAAWAQQQAASAALRERMAWSADGKSLSVRPWAADGLAQGQELQPRDRIVIALERAAPA